MSDTEDRKSPHEIVIVRRRPGGHGDGHHGGAWKIAFADFMTALMCFFLVMWLVNASDKKTITQIATYFNPLRLNDRVSSQKGLDDPDGRTPPPDSGTKRQSQKTKPSDSKNKGSREDGAVSHKSDRASAAERALAAELDLIRDPYGVIEQIVASEAALAQSSTASGSTARARMPRDVFDPRNAQSGEGTREDAGQNSARHAAAGGRVAPRRDPAAVVVQVSQDVGADIQSANRQSQPSDNSTLGVLSADRVKAEIAESISNLNTGLKPRIEITDLGREILISITDEIDHGMFGIGSSKPTPVLIQVMESVGRALSANGGAIILRGHTDARPYSNAGYDNWRLSAARAQMAYYMLVRSGVQPERVHRIEGHADRALRYPGNPLAPHNRRIEILVAKEQS